MYHGLHQLQAWLSAQNTPGIAVCTNNDPHCSEIPAPLFCFRSYLSGFNGSYGTLVVTNTEVHLWTDSRYFLQARETLRKTPITLHLLSKNDSPKTWIITNTPEDSTIHFFHETFTEFCSYKDLCKPRRCNAHLSYPEKVWDNRPEAVCNPIRLLPSSSIDTVMQNLQTIREAMELQECTTHFITSLDDIACITNLRASDLPHQQLFHAFLIIQKESAQLFLRDAAQLTVEAAQLLAQASLEIRNYLDIEDFLLSLSKHDPVLLDPARIDAGFLPYFSAPVLFAEQPSAMIKAIKSDIELTNLQEAHRHDGVAMLRTIYAIQDAKTNDLTETMIAQLCRDHRSIEKSYLGDSFSPICASGPHAAIPHHNTGDTPLLDHTVLLIDSGGQYETGTTDITRVFAIGAVAEQIKIDYTLVLKAHIHLSTLLFPPGTQGRELHAICKSVLWRQKQDFHHGSGHGVGYATAVHENPPNISTRLGDTVLEAGMVFSVEPGLYREGSHGIRIENLVSVNSCDTDADPFYYLHTLSLCPYEKELILPELLSAEERTWINAYHARVYEELSPLINADERNRLQKMTTPL